jgi:hypothetical protein
MPKATQSFSNHRQLNPLYHFVAQPLGLIFLIWSVQRVISNPNADTAYMLVGALALAAAIGVARTQVLRTQDRLIRLEERLRLKRVLPAELQARIDELRPRHLIALRFASDEEVTDLAREVFANPALTPKEIKQKVRQWRADHFRA